MNDLLLVIGLAVVSAVVIGSLIHYIVGEVEFYKALRDMDDI